MADSGTTSHVVSPEEWATRWAEAQRDGFTWWDMLAAAECDGGMLVCARARRPGDWAGIEVTVRLDAAEPTLTSLSSLYAGATWCEREAEEMLGVRFIGLADRRSLLLREPPIVPPLRHDAWLTARTDRPWPGAVRVTEGDGDGQGKSQARRDNPGRRRQSPIGVPHTRAVDGGTP